MENEYRTKSVRGVIRIADRILVDWFAPKSIFLPGGTVESHEELKSALIRELEEELQSIELSIGRYLGKIGPFWNTPKGSDSCLNHFYEAILKGDSGITAREPGRQIR